MIKTKVVPSLNQSMDTGLGQFNVFRLVNVHPKSLSQATPVSEADSLGEIAPILCCRPLVEEKMVHRRVCTKK